MNTLDSSDFFTLEKSDLSKDDLDHFKNKYPGIPIHGTVIKGNPIWHSKQMSIFFFEGLSDSFRIYTSRNIPNNSYFIFSNPWTPYTEAHLKQQLDFFHDITHNKFNNSQIIHIANDTQSLNTAKSIGLHRSIFCNQNAFIDFNVFKIIRESNRKQFDLAINCRPEGFKRPFLANGVERLLVIQGANHNPLDFFDLNQLNPKYINKTRISQVEVNDLINQAKVGGIFSASEGACFASSEFLLAGLPVVSTHSIGGRDFWYDESNSIICDPTEESVSIAVNSAIEKINSGEFSPEKIRSSHINKSLSLRSDFCTLLQSLLDENNESIHAKTLLKAYLSGGSLFKKSKYPLY